MRLGRRGESDIGEARSAPLRNRPNGERAGDARSLEGCWPTAPPLLIFSPRRASFPHQERGGTTP